MKIIEKLTKEQEAQLTVYRDEGLRVGLDTDDEYDLERVKELINKVRALHSTPLPEVKEWILLDSPFEACKIPGVTPANALYGSQDIHWLQFYKYFRDVCGLKKQTEKTVALRELAELIGWFWLSEDKVIITRKPCKISVSYRKGSNGDRVPVIHDTEGMAIQYRDGTGVYKLDDIRIPSAYTWLFTEKHRRTPEEILKIDDVDIRNAALKLLGPDGLISAVDHDVIEERDITVAHTPLGKIPAEGTDLAEVFGLTYKNVTTHYRLIGFTLNDVYRIYLNGVCPSKGEKFTEAVPPGCNTVYKALNWRETGIISDEYTAPVVRT